MSGFQRFLLVTLRLAIGWHLLSEGVGKLRAVEWSGRGYLSGAQGPLSEFFHSMSQNEGLLRISDACVMYGLVFAGACLLLGLFTRLGCVLGIVLLTLFYLAQPPWGWTPQPGTESNYLFVNKNVIEALGLCVVMAFPTGRFIGLDAVAYPILGKHFPYWLVGVPSEEA
jgi:thiosulfate dehydrogenase [quinone] large subunit